jgi:hypothetical protein
MPLIYDHPRQPPEGHYFVDPSGHTIRSESIESLISEVVSYRTRNGLTAGNPAKEVEQFYAVKFPWLITNIGTTPVSKEDPITKWINRMWRTPIKDWSEAEIVEARVERCESCEYYVADHAFGVESTRRLIILGAGRLRSMGVCKAHLWACGLAVLPHKLDSPVKAGGCWLT